MGGYYYINICRKRFLFSFFNQIIHFSSPPMEVQLRLFWFVFLGVSIHGSTCVIKTTRPRFTCKHAHPVLTFSHRLSYISSYMYSLDKLTLCPCAPLYSQNKQHQTEQVAALRLNWIPSFSGLTEIVKALPNSEVQNSPKYDRFGCLK